MKSQKEFVLDQKDTHNPSKHIRMPVCIMVESSSEMEKYKNELERSLNKLFSELQMNDNTRCTVDMALYLYSDCILVSEISENTSLEVVFERRIPNLFSCFLEVVKRLRIRKSDYKVDGLSYYQPALVIVSTGISSDDKLDKVKATQVAKEFYYSGACIIPILIGNNTPDVLEQIAPDGKYYTGSLYEIGKIFDKLKKSMENLSQSSSNARESILAQKVDWEECIKYFR